MPALWSPEDLATRFAAYIEELHDLFAMHGLHYGLPEDIRLLAVRLETDASLNEELASVVRSMVLREGGSIPRTDLLEIVAIAVAGPRMDAAGGELQQAVRQLLTFLCGALRRPWNEPHGEERLHPEQDLRAEAARELREAAARIEAEAQTEAPQNRAPISIEGAAEDYQLHGNVIPFGRARAVFSRLARIDGTEFDGSLEQNDALPSSVETAGIVDSRPEAHTDGAVANHIPLAAGQSDAKVSPRASIARAYDLASSQTKARKRTLWLGTAASPPTEAPSEDKVETQNAGDAQDTQETTAEAVAEHTPEPFFAPIQIPGPTPAEDAISGFDEERPLPTTPQFNRVALMSGVAAMVLIAAGLVFAVRARTGTTETAAQPQQPIVEVSHSAKPAAAVARPVVRQTSVPTSKTTKPNTDLSQSEDSRTSRAEYDGDYIAPPYSNMPAQPTPTTTAVANQPETQAVTQSSTSPAPALERRETPVQQVSEVSTQSQHPSNPLRPSNPDSRVVGDTLVSADERNLAFADSPLRPSIPPAVMAGNLVSSPTPDYPVLAKLAHADGPVVLHAEITQGGTVSEMRVISGHLLLRRAAEAAVRHWRYRPYQVDGKPVAVSTTITVRFKNGH